MHRGFLLLAFVVASIALLAMLPERQPESTPPAVAPPKTINLAPPTILPTDPVRGHPNALLTIIEYADFTCEACRSLEPDLTALREEYGLQLRIIWKDAPLLDRLTGSRTLHIAAACAAEQGKFWEYHDALLANPYAYRSNDALAVLAASFGIERSKFDQCTADPRTSRRVDGNASDAKRRGIDAVPVVYVNGTRVSEYPTRATITTLLDNR